MARGEGPLPSMAATLPAQRIWTKNEASWRAAMTRPHGVEVQSRADWSPQQVEALEKIHHWPRRGQQQVFRLAGYAGTGKTEIALEVGSWRHKVTFCGL